MRMNTTTYLMSANGQRPKGWLGLFTGLGIRQANFLKLA